MNDAEVIWVVTDALNERRRERLSVEKQRDELLAALEGIRPFVAEDFPEKVGEIDWNAYPVSFGYAKAYRALLVALGRLPA